MHWIPLWHWAIHAMGVDNGFRYGTWNWYNFWSGFGSDIAEIAILGGIIQLYRRHNCCVHNCFRIGRHRVNGLYLVCTPHLPVMTEERKRAKKKKLTHSYVVREYQHNGHRQRSGDHLDDDD